MVDVNEIFSEGTVFFFKIEAANDAIEPMVLKARLACPCIAFICVHPDLFSRSFDVLSTGFQLIWEQALTGGAVCDHGFAELTQAFSGDRNLGIRK